MRKSGVLMHITSLPGAEGVGTLGKGAYEFVDFLKKAGQSCWQMLPLNPTGCGNSPYQSWSSFSGNIYLIDLEFLVEEGLLLPEELQALPKSEREDQVNFGLLWESRQSILRKAYARFDDHQMLDSFIQEKSEWLPDVALYQALKVENDGKPWYQWPEPQKNRDFQAIWEACDRLAEEIRFYCFLQYIFSDQWIRLRAYATQQGISIIGDVPFYVPLDSVDVWTAPDLFLLDYTLTPTDVAGCPPDAFNQEGQLWGNPLYDWEMMRAEDYYWWLHRLDRASEMFDYIRLDHFRALESYWSVPYGETTACNGRWEQGPGTEFLETVKASLPHLKLIAEDLGYVTPEVVKLREESGWPGMKVLQFAFEQEPITDAPHTYIQNAVCYTGTHDNMTVKQWLETMRPEELARARTYMKLTDATDVWGVIRTAQETACDLCIVPMQDYLTLGAEGRMNTPGTAEGNWQWRMLPGCCTDDLAQKIYNLTEQCNRLPEKMEIPMF